MEDGAPFRESWTKYFFLCLIEKHNLSRYSTDNSLHSRTMKKIPKYILICIIFFLVLSLLNFFLLWKRANTPVVESVETLEEPVIVEVIPEPEFEYEVQYTAEGYSPNVLEVEIGSRVAFHNMSDIPMWTASDPHPVHSDFSDFDAQRGYGVGETYIYQFQNVGTFGFHNHMKSLHRGVIRVIDPENPAPEIDKAKESQRATRDEFLAMLKQDDPDSIFMLIDAIEANNSLARDCHDIAHDFGHRAYELYGFSTAMTFSNPNRLSHTSVDDICAGGYIHGILEEVFLHQPKLRENPEIICSAVPDINRGSCFHGVGHGLMFVNKRDVAVSLADCEKMPDSVDRNRCFEGVWMEMFWGNTDHAGANSLGWTVEQPLTPCSNATEIQKPACFLYAHLGYLRTNPRNFEGAIALCTQEDVVETDRHFCLKGIGITMMKHFTSHRLEQAENLARNLSASEKYAYYAGVIGYARLSGVSEDDISSFCEKLSNDTDICIAVMKNKPL